MSKVVSHDEWLAARHRVSRQGEGVHPPPRRTEPAAPRAAVREVEETYMFQSPVGPKSLGDLSAEEPARVYHSCRPGWKEGCRAARSCRSFDGALRT